MTTSAFVLSALALVLSLLACVLCAFLMRGRGKLPTLVSQWVADGMQEQLDQASSIVNEATELLPQVKSWNSRLLASIRHAEGKKEGGSEATDDDAGGELPAWVQGIAEGSGLDMGRLKAGDPAELQKAMDLLGNAARKGPAGGKQYV